MVGALLELVVGFRVGQGCLGSKVVVRGIDLGFVRLYVGEALRLTSWS